MTNAKPRALVAGIAMLSVTSAAEAQIAGRSVPAPIYGVTLDDVSKVSAELKTLASIYHTPTVRVVFDRGESPSYYKGPIQQFRQVSYVMGELIDSSYMRRFQTIAAVQSWTNSYVNTLGSLVDIWEIGNEINGNWLGSNAFGKMAAMYDIVAGKGGKTALTFFYDDTCVGSQDGMFPWIARHFTASPTPESEKIRTGLNYVLISWYPDQCSGENPSWPAVYTKLAGIFPNAKVGFGELGTANPQGGSAYEKNEINTYYPLAKTTPGLPANYVGGYFFWYYAEDGVPWPGANSIDDVLNAAISVGP